MKGASGTRVLPIVAAGALCLVSGCAGPSLPEADRLLIVCETGWSAGQEGRAIVARGRLFLGLAGEDPERGALMEVIQADLDTGTTTEFPLHAPAGGRSAEARLPLRAPALLALPDGRVLATYMPPGAARLHWRRTEERADARAWSAAKGMDAGEATAVLDSSLHWLGSEGRRGRVFQVIRVPDDEGVLHPEWLQSDDLGETWRPGGRLIDWEEPGVATGEETSPQTLKVASDGRRILHLAFTAGRPETSGQGVYHAVIRAGMFERIRGARVRPIREGPLRPGEAVCVYRGAPGTIVEVQDVVADPRGRVRIAFSIARTPDGIHGPGRRAAAGNLQYAWAEWDGRAWWVHELAHGGFVSPPGSGEEAGGICLHPADPRVVYVSTNVDPAVGTPLVGGRHEIFRGRSTGERARRRWEWVPITPGALEDNLRPQVPRMRTKRGVLAWVRRSAEGPGPGFEVVARGEGP